MSAFLLGVCCFRTKRRQPARELMDKPPTRIKTSCGCLLKRPALRRRRAWNRCTRDPPKIKRGVFGTVVHHRGGRNRIVFMVPKIPSRCMQHRHEVVAQNLSEMAGLMRVSQQTDSLRGQSFPTLSAFFSREIVHAVLSGWVRRNRDSW